MVRAAFMRPLMGLTGILVFSTVGSPNQGAFEGTFIFVSHEINKNGNYLVIQAVRRGDSVQISGRSFFLGKHTANLTGSYYPRSNEFRGKSQSLNENREVSQIDGKFDFASESYQFWEPRTNRYNFFAKKVYATDTIGEYGYGSGRFQISIRKTGSGYEVSGHHDNYPIKGSYLTRSNEIAATSSQFNFDGVYDPYSRGIFVWARAKQGVSGGNGGFVLPRTMATQEANPPIPRISLDPATQPGAIWSQRETYKTEISGTWKLLPDGKTFEARWGNGATAKLTLVVFSDTEIVVTRNDQDGVSKGLQANYKGQRSGKKVSGTVDWTWADGKKASGKWSADLP